MKRCSKCKGCMTWTPDIIYKELNHWSCINCGEVDYVNLKGVEDEPRYFSRGNKLLRHMDSADGEARRTVSLPSKYRKKKSSDGESN